MLQRSLVLLCAVCCLALTSFAQDHLIDQVYGTSPDRPEGYAFTHVIHYDLVQRVEAGEGLPLNKVEGQMDLFYTPGDSAYARQLVLDGMTLTHVGDLRLGMRYALSDLGTAKLGTETSLSSAMLDTIQMSRVSGDREIDGRMSAHYWQEEGTVINELWADSQASAEEVSIGRLWPRFEPGFQSLAIGTYVGLATRWVSIDTEFSREPRVVLQFKGTEELESPVEISLEGFAFPVSPGDMMRQRLEAERQ
ncbi:MAG: hypothetical protein CMC97_04695 [Flavobacteriales bacterium]|nr:hypothetical protein [Flavobacteriales bacterium]